MASNVARATLAIPFTDAFSVDRGARARFRHREHGAKAIRVPSRRDALGDERNLGASARVVSPKTRRDRSPLGGRLVRGSFWASPQYRRGARTL